MAKLLITGGAGYIGSHVVRYLVQEKDFLPQDIIVFDNLLQGHPEFLPSGVRCIKGDLKNKKDIEDVFSAEDIHAVIHLAGILNVAESMQQPELYFDNNVVGGLHLLEAMVKYDCRTIVFSSSCTVYGQAPEAVHEDTPCLPINPYGESKLQLERMMEWFSRIHDIKAVSLRYFNAAGAAYGIGESHDPEIHLIPSLLNAVRSGQVFTAYGDDYDTPDGTCIRDYIHVSDLADAHLRALEYLKTSLPELTVFNLGTGTGVSVKEMIGLVEKITGMPVKVNYTQRRPGDAPRMVAVAKKAAAELGWKPQYTIDKCIEDAWNWLQNGKN